MNLRPYFVLFCLIIFLFASTAATAQDGGQALRLDNADFTTGGDFVYFPMHNYNFGDQLTVAAWVKWEVTPNGPVSNPHEPSESKWSNLVTMDFHDAVNQGQFWLQHNAGNTKFAWAIWASTLYQVTSSTVPQEGNWYNVVGVYDGSPAVGNTSILLYVNGIAEASQPLSTISGNINTHDNRLRLNIGRIPSDYRFFTGQVDEVRIWKRALTSEEIRKQMYSAKTINPADLVGYYNMNSTTGTSVIDSTSNSNGTFYTALVDVHTAGNKPCSTFLFTDYTSSAPWIIADADKDWTGYNFSGMPTRTVSGAGVDQTNTVFSNNCNTLTLLRGWSGSAPDTIVTPIVDGAQYDTWLGIEDVSQTSQWQASKVPVANVVKNVATTTLTTLGTTGTEMRVTITSVPSGTDHIIAYTYGSASDPPVTSGETFPGTVDRRAAVVWGSKVFGSVTATENFDYSGLAGISDPSGVVLLRRTPGTTVWTDAGASNNTSTRLLTLTGITGSYEYSIGVYSGVNPLPVELVSFAAHRGSNGISLRWQTATELNSYVFEIETRKESASDWRIVASVPAAGMSNSPRSYEWTHTLASTAAMQYRLHMIDRDGSSAHSAVLSVRADNSPLSLSFEVYPNPASGQATLQLDLSEAMDVSVRMTDILGRIRDLPVERHLDAGASVWPLDVRQYSPGLYLLEIRTPQGRYVRPLRLTR